MSSQTCVVDNRMFLLGLDDLFRESIKRHERGELLECARITCDALQVSPASGPVEGYYTEDDSLTEYFYRMRALQSVPRAKQPAVTKLEAFRRLLEIASSPLFGEPIWRHGLLPSGNDPLSKALASIRPNWTIHDLTNAAHRHSVDSNDISLVGLAALANDPLVLAALRESVVLYTFAVLGAARSVAQEYVWAVDVAVAERAKRFVTVFNSIFSESLPIPGAENAKPFWCAATKTDVCGRCVRLGYDESTGTIMHYHWAIVSSHGGYHVREFWDGELWTTKRFQAALRNKTVPFDLLPQ